VLQRGEVGDLGAGLFQLLQVDRAHPAHRVGGRGRGFPGADDLLDLRQGKPEIVELANPAHAVDGGLIVEPIAALRAGVRLEQAHLFVVVNGPDRLAAHFGDVADLEQALARVVAYVDHVVHGTVVDGGGARRGRRRSNGEVADRSHREP